MIHQIDEYFEMSFNNNIRDIKMTDINVNGCNLLSNWTSNKKIFIHWYGQVGIVSIILRRMKNVCSCVCFKETSNLNQCRWKRHHFPANFVPRNGYGQINFIQNFRFIFALEIFRLFIVFHDVLFDTFGQNRLNFL